MKKITYLYRKSVNDIRKYLVKRKIFKIRNVLTSTSSVYLFSQPIFYHSNIMVVYIHHLNKNSKNKNQLPTVKLAKIEITETSDF